ncbi:LamB/YcsF family protein [Rhodotorula diobovata]|uniref:LamB/YcsF family protein n=1 Tax=Rhodotorula diobovata TaxID=5288 RepID=A0A5C5FPW5_9BASI|nr:LamB/YcsF family protein [Rhodotorula diobovata]
MPLEASLNCDAGESFGPYSIGDDENLFPLVSLVNAACGFHGSDFDVMKKTAELAKKHGVGIGAHPSLPDQQGFGRRVMHLPPDSFFNCLLYQVGALVAFLKLENLPLSHIKCHGQAYVMASKDLDLARQIARIAKLYAVPMLGMPGTAHQEACQLEGVDFVPEWYVDVLYGDEGQLLAPRSAALRDPVTPEDVYKRARRMIETGTWTSKSGAKELSFPEGTTKVSICVHGDFPGAVDVAGAVRRAINDVQNE